MNDYVYEHAPLIEVIAEIHWGLKHIETAADARIDPYYDMFKDEFLNDARSDQMLRHVEELVPGIVPLELLPHQPRIRVRPAEEKWPLAQLGPGIVTANIIPPYEGWMAFEPFLHKIIESLFKNYPLAQKTLRIEKLHLRYIDGFDETFGFESYTDCASRMLGIQMPLSAVVIEQNVKKGTEITYLLEERFLNISPEGSSGRIKLAPGKIRGNDGLILETQCERSFVDHSNVQLEDVKKWFREAHERLHVLFDALATADLKARMGSKRRI